MSVTRAHAEAWPDLWTLALNRTWVDPAEFAHAIEDQVAQGDLDFRTRLLIRDGIEALMQVWGRARLEDLIAASPVGERLLAIRSEQLGPPGFPFIAKQLMEPTTPHTIQQMLRELGTITGEKTRLAIGGSAALILRGLITRQTQDIDVVDEVPAAIRSQHDQLNKLTERYRLQLTHFQSHYLPSGWETRLIPLDRYGSIEVLLVNPYDVALSKMMSNREKDRDDLRVIAPRLDKQALIARLRDSCGSLLTEPDLRTSAEKNWYILFGEPLPVSA